MPSPANILPTDTPKLKELVDEYLREQIFEKRALTSGDQIHERELSRVLGLSRAPIREALKELEEQGLLVSKKYRGWFVADFREEEFFEINKLRSLLEYNLLESVMRLGGPEAQELTELEAINEELRAIMESDEENEQKAFDYAEKEIVFHAALHALGKENCFWTQKILRNLSYQLRSAFHYCLYEAWQMELSVAFHDVLLQCLREKDSTSLREILFRRLEKGPLAALSSPREKDADHNGMTGRWTF